MNTFPAPEAIDEAAATIFEVIQIDDSATKAELLTYCQRHGIDSNLFAKAFALLDQQLDVITQTTSIRDNDRVWKVKANERNTNYGHILARARRFHTAR